MRTVAEALNTSGAVTATSTTDNDYAWWDEAKQKTVTVAGGTQNATSTFSYDANGHAKTVVVTGANARTLTYVNDAYGQVLEREARWPSGVLGPRQLYYYFDGHRIGDVGNDGPSRVDYAGALAARGAQTRTSLYRAGEPVASADFDQNYAPISPDYPGAAASRVTARDGDTLRTIARAAWGDATLWWLIADANGLSNPDAALIAGQSLIVPNKVTNFHNTSQTFRVYNPGEAIGDALPLLPPEPAPPPPPSPHGQHGCGQQSCGIPAARRGPRETGPPRPPRLKVGPGAGSRRALIPP